MLVVGITTQPNASHVMRMGPRPSVDMIVFEHAGFRASVPLLVHKSALALIARMRLAPERGGNGSTATVFRLPHASRTRLAADGETLLLHLLDEEVHCQFDDTCQV